MECGHSEIDELIKERPVDEYMGMVKRSPSPPEACRNQPLPDWWMQQPGAAGLPLVPGYPAYDAHHSGTKRSGPGRVGDTLKTKLEGPVWVLEGPWMSMIWCQKPGT
ncbi:hypothetical protein QTO34_010568 [Cnephaeus nilssonii]|uniref:Uncharacterized protein n=1 Tax=Cnephaeus nilssonii TaxID=3371016 RepID=A0AA40HFT6_CNENI|nr:hypothetical protein QTO34_010568 [Eptesicus nilssonii]